MPVLIFAVSTSETNYTYCMQWSNGVVVHKYRGRGCTDSENVL